MKPHLSLSLVLFVSLPLTAIAQTPVVDSNRPLPVVHPALAADYGKLPLSFEANQGQSDPRVRFLSRGNGYSVFLTDSAAVLALAKPESSTAVRLDRSSWSEKNPTAHPAKSVRTDVVRMELLGASGDLRMTGVEQLPGTANYFTGKDPSTWHTNVPTYAKVRYSGVYPGVDLVYYGNQQHLEYDFILAPGADPRPLRLHFAGALSLKIDASGDLAVAANNGEITLQKPIVYQMKDGLRRPIDGHFKLLANNSVGFTIGSYDHSQALVIDPKLAYSTYLGGSGSYSSFGRGIAVDSEGFAYVVGDTKAPDFPTTDGGLSSIADRAFITKLNKNGTGLVYSTVLGGGVANGIAVDGSGNAYIGGTTSASDFPITPGAFQTAMEPGDFVSGFVTKLNPAGTALTYSTYLAGGGENGGDGVTTITTDAQGRAYVAGFAGSISFPVTANAYQPSNQGTAQGIPTGFVTEFNAAGSALVYSTYLGGDNQDQPYGIAVDDQGYIYVTGSDSATDNTFPTTPGVVQPTGSGAYVIKFTLAGDEAIYSTYLDAGSGNAIAVDKSGNAYIAGTAGPGFPATAGAFQKTYPGIPTPFIGTSFVLKLNPDATAFVYATYLGGSYQDTVTALAIDAAGDAYVTGSAYSRDFPVTEDAFQSMHGGDPSVIGSNAFLSELNPSGTALIYSSFLGGSAQGIFAPDNGAGIALDPSANAYLAGSALSTDFPTTKGAFQQADPAGTSGAINAFVSKFSLREHVVRIDTTTELTSSKNPVKVGATVTFKAEVQANSGTGTPTGSLTASVNGTNFIQVPLNDSGEASFPVTTKVPGRYRIMAVYSGDENYLHSRATVVETTIGPPARVTVVSGSEQKADLGSAFAAPLVVRVKDVDGEPIPGVTVTFSGSDLRFSSATAVTGSNGEASVDATPETAGRLTAEAAVSGLSSAASFALTATKVH